MKPSSPEPFLLPNLPILSKPISALSGLAILTLRSLPCYQALSVFYQSKNVSHLPTLLEKQ
jgi:hypothetical protein